MSSFSEIPTSFWFSIADAAFLTGSAFTLSIQRIYERRRLQVSTITSKNFKTDTERDVINDPFSNGNRLTRVIFNSLVLSIVFSYLFYKQVSRNAGNELFVYAVIGSVISFTTSIYCLVLATTATRYPLPNAFGWKLNAHLCVLFIALLFVSSASLISTLWDTPAITFVESIPFFLPVIVGFDLVYITSTVTNGSVFLDENGKAVNGQNVQSLLGIFYFFWLTPIINKINLKGSKLTDIDLPTLPPTHRSHNMFYIFGESRGIKLLRRIYHSNAFAINMQILLSLILPIFTFASPFFLNKLLLTIQEITSGSADDRSIYRGIGYILGMSAAIIIQNVLIGQLWFYAQSNVQIRIKSMLNIEIYRKTLRRMDTSVLSGGKKSNTKDDDNKKDDEEESTAKMAKEDDVSSQTGMIVNLMSTDSARISDFASWWFVVIEAPLELVIGVYFLFTLMGWSSIVGLMIMVVTIPANHYNSKWFIKTQDKLMKARDKRVSLMNEVLQGIRQIKFFAWEKRWMDRILDSRNEELRRLKQTYLSEVLFMFLWQGTPLLVTTLSFLVFTRFEGKELTAPIAFTSITIFTELRSSLTIIPETIIRLFESLISVKRIEQYLAEDEIKQPIPTSNNSSTTPFLHENDTNYPLSSSDIKLGFENATVSWPSPKSNSAAHETPKISVNADDTQVQTLINVDEPDFTSESTLDNESDTFILKDLDVTFPNNKLSLICGATGSGKTLLMLSLLGETETRKGHVYCPRSASSSSLDDSTAITSIKVSEDAEAIPSDWILQYAVAYVAQTAWLQNASIKDNILFGLPFVQKRYRATLTACALDKDLSYLEDGDRTEIGEKGITLSGGQKARVALARAVYSRAQNVLLDDVLSAVDAHTAKHLYKRVLLGPLMKGRTQVLITHHVNLCIHGSAHVVFVKDGRIGFSGSPAELKEKDELSQIFENNTAHGDEAEEDQIVEIEVNELNETTAKIVEEKKQPKALVEEERRASGMVKMRLYKMYFQMVGRWYFWVLIFSLIIGARSLDISSTWWVKKWAQSYEDLPTKGGDLFAAAAYPVAGGIEKSFASALQLPINVASKLQSYTAVPIIISADEKKDRLNMFLGVYVLLNIINITVNVMRFATIFYGGLRATRKLYIALLERVFRAPLRFFDTTPLGRIVNRFAKDFETIDASVPTDIIQFLGQWTTVCSIIIVATSVLPPIVVVMILVALTNIYFGLRFVGASRELKRMDSVSRSPLFTHFSETIIGISTIRAFGMTQQFMLDMLNRIDVNARPMYYAWTVSRWVSTRISLMGSLMTLVTGILIIFNLDHLDASTAGFCLTYVLIFTNMTYWGVRRYTVLEMSFNAVERVVEYLEMDQEAPATTDIRPPTNWPSHGAIKIKDLHVSYAADLEPVLRGLNISIKPQEKIGVVGRTGSGKSTLALSFFRFIEASKGSIVIDDINIADIGTEDLRSSLTIIPQDPVLFSGTLGSNMDPFDQFTKEEIFTALRRVQLIPSVETPVEHDAEEVNANTFYNLQTSVTEGGKNFSQGQRQLLCLARALLKRSKVVLMDEATASVDFETDKAIQKTISQEFAECTILCIAHRLNTVIEYDRILVLDHGEVLEFASPLELLNDPESAFYKMCRNSGEFENLVELAKAKHQLVDIS